MEQEQVQKKKRRKKHLKKILLVDIEQLNVEELLATIKEIRFKLRVLFRLHIGFENATSPVEMFYEVYGVNPDSLNPYERSYWWRVLQKVMSQLRHNNDLFIVHKGHKYFVLRTHQEANYYKDILRRNIINMEKSMKRADSWVTKKKFAEF